MTSVKGRLAHLHSSALATELAILRASINGLVAKFNEYEYPGNAELAQRAEHVSAAIQHLERALARQQLLRMSSASGA
jgi:hypothetical protein